MKGGRIMRQIKLLDCTLRDGGFVNNWNFGYGNIVSIFERLVKSGVDIIEIGWLDSREPFSMERTIAPSTKHLGEMFGKLDSKESTIVAMIDYGACPIENIEPCGSNGIDGIRVIFKKHMRIDALAFCKQLQVLGYKVFVQAVSITSYSSDELMDLVKLINELTPYAVSIVDTYGLLHKDNLLHYFRMLEAHLNKEIKIGFHSHNNFQLAYANSMELLNENTERDLMLDGSLYGMGKSAGNTPLELLAMHLNENYEKRYDLNPILEAIDGNIMKFYRENPWGYNLFYFIASSNRCHPSYVQYLLDKHTLSIQSVNDILQNIKEEQKLSYKEEVIEQLYYAHKSIAYDDVMAKDTLKTALNSKEILVMGPGKTIRTQETLIKSYIEKNRPITIAINYVPENIAVDYIFLSNPRRHIRVETALRESKNRHSKIIATSNVVSPIQSFEYVINSMKIREYDKESFDNSFIMLMKLLQEIEIDNVACAGIDGYSANGENYFDKEFEHWFSTPKTEKWNTYVKEKMMLFRKKMKIKFLTKTYYEEKQDE